jgi:hypothetical protein
MADQHRDEALIKLITNRQSKLETDKLVFNDRFQEVADFVAPHREDILGTLQRGERKARKIYDGTAVSAAVLATDGIHGYHVSPAFPWFRYSMNRKEVNKIAEVRDWLQEIEFNMYNALNRSNFYSEMWSYIYDGLTIGTGDIYPEEDIVEEKIIFETVHPGEIFIEENKYGEIDVLHRKRKWSARKLVQAFGEENLPESIKTAYKTQPFHEFDIIQAIFPREEYDSRLKDAKNKRFASCWMLPADRWIARVSGFDRFRHNVWRYMKSGKEPYGISPAMLAMADIMGVNLMSKTLLGAAQNAVDPSYNVPGYLEGKVQLKPRGFNFMENASDKITPVNSGMNYPVGIDREEAKQAAIKERFHVDTFLMLASLGGTGQRTAYEVSQMMAEKAAVLGAELGPLNTQIDNTLDHVYDIEVAAGRMPSPPDILLELADSDPFLRFDPVYMGPLAQSQRDQFAKNPIRNFMMDIAPIAQIKEDVLDNFNFDKMALDLASINNLEADNIVDEDERDQVREGRMLAMQQQSQQEDVAAGVDTLKTATEADQNMNGQLAQALAGAAGV